MPLTNTNEIRAALQSIKGEHVMLYAKGERNRVVKATGILDGVYPSIFTIAAVTDGHPHKFSYTYNEVVTKKVSVKPVEKL